MELHLILIESGKISDALTVVVKVKRDISAQGVMAQLKFTLSQVREDKHGSPSLYCCVSKIGQGTFLCYCLRVSVCLSVCVYVLGVFYVVCMHVCIYNIL